MQDSEKHFCSDRERNQEENKCLFMSLNVTSRHVRPENLVAATAHEIFDRRSPIFTQMIIGMKYRYDSFVTHMALKVTNAETPKCTRMYNGDVVHLELVFM